MADLGRRGRSAKCYQFIASALGRSQGFANRPSALEPRLYHGMTEPGSPSPFGERKSNPSVANSPVGSRVAILFRFGSPSAILWAVRAVIVDSLDRVSRRWLSSHICKKALEGFPARTYGDAAASIIFISWVRDPKAARQHIRPRVIFRRICAAMCFVGFGSQAAVLASATDVFAPPQVANVRATSSPAYAAAMPDVSSLVVLAGKRHYGQKPVLAPGLVLESSGCRQHRQGPERNKTDHKKSGRRLVRGGVPFLI